MSAAVHKIAEQLEPLAIRVSDLTLDPRNARRHPERNLEAIKASLTTYGQRKPLVVRREGLIVEAGNGTLLAVQALGWTHVAAVLVDDDPLTATGYSIADNRTAELAVWDEAALSQLLAELHEADLDVDLDALGWSDEELNRLLGSVPAFAPTGPEEQGNLGELSPQLCPHCGADVRVPPAR